MKVYIIPNTGKAAALKTGREAAALLCAQGAEVLVDEAGAPLAQALAPVRVLPAGQAHAECDVVLTVGGDGTLLHAARRAARQQKPLLGVNVGRLGFLTLVESDDLQPLKRLSAGDYTVEHRGVLRADDPDGRAEICYALNDVVLFKAEPERTVSLEIYCDDILVSRFRGDGIILATPTGSTAYSMSAGGPILDAALGGIVVTQICAHIVHNPPMVFAPTRLVRVAVCGAADELLAVICDGSKLQTLQPGQAVCVSQAEWTVPLVQFGEGEQLRAIDSKLKGR